MKRLIITNAILISLICASIGLARTWAPRSDGAGSLGESTNRWGSVYGNVGDFTTVMLGGTNLATRLADYYPASNPSNYVDAAAVTNIVMTSYAVPYDASGDAVAGATNALEIALAWGSEIVYAGGTNAVVVGMADSWPQYASVGMVSLAISNATHAVLAGARIDSNSWASVEWRTNGWGTVSLRRNYGETLWYAVPFSQ